MTPRGIIFDLDGTLTDSKPGLLAGLRHMHRTLGWEVPPDDELERWLGPPTVTILAEAGHPQPVIDRAIAAFRAALDAGALLESRLYPGIAPLLARLHDARRPMGVATHKIQRDAVAVVEHYGLSERFRGVHGRMPDEVGHSKAPVIARAVASIGLPPGELVMVGDRVNDIASAHELGMPSIGVAYGYGGRDELAAAGATRIVDSVDELADLLG
ncbi:HAD hydrolase-like protein [Agrococcus carbonis]|uniref:Phosphoglycolate phosphatase n=1 Tax=Agrococcus carbonis TaxID=684552 RepID=A0A1H1QT99_9MICO|nr:HAD hydrolase-like protein [Agrococcus carbonis]SDS26543.1 phosphoglycolate phosphatase [Agrococcus carbonis]